MYKRSVKMSAALAAGVITVAEAEQLTAAYLEANPDKDPEKLDLRVTMTEQEYRAYINKGKPVNKSAKKSKRKKQRNARRIARG